jgi:hypothetical protein
MKNGWRVESVVRQTVNGLTRRGVDENCRSSVYVTSETW